MTAIDRVNEWTLAFCNNRSKIIDGSPLWAYKVSDEELDFLQKSFKGLFASLSHCTVFEYYINRIDKPLVIYMATWLQRNTKGRAKWELVTDSLGLKYDNSTRSNIIECVKSGLEKWGLSVHFTINNRYLDTLYCHGGFPRSDMLGICNSHLMEYFERVLSHYVSYEYSSELQLLAIQELSFLPESLQQEPFSKLTTTLIEFLIELRDEFHLYDCIDPLAMLETKQPEWKSKLPFLMIDEEADVLVNKLLNITSRVVRRSQNPVRLKRYLKKEGEDFSINAEVYVNHTIHPEDLSSVFGGVLLPNYFELASYTAEGQRYRTASFSYRAGAAPRWMVSTLEYIVTHEAAFGELSYQLFADGESFGSGVYYNGEALADNFPWYFEDKPNQSCFIGQGSLRTSASSIYVICDCEPKKFSRYSSYEKIGRISAANRNIYRITGHLKIESVFGDFHVRTDESQTIAPKIKVLGNRYNKILSDHPTYTGKPNLIIDEDSDDLEFNPDEFFWVNKAKNQVKYFNNDDVIGEGSIVWICGDEVRWVHQCLILPSVFDVELIHIEQGNFEAKFSGLKNVVIGMGKGQEAWIVEEPEELLGFYFAEVNVPSLIADYVSFRIFWNNDLTTESIINIPIQIDSVVLVNRQNLVYRAIEMGRLTIEDLNQLSVLIKSNLEQSVVRVKADLMNMDKLIATVSSELQIESFADRYKISGRNLSNLSNRLFRHGTTPDNKINLTFYANNNILENQIPIIHRYKQVLEIQKEKNQASLDKILNKSQEQSQLKLKMSPIWELEREPLIIKSGHLINSKLTFDLPQITEYGTWLLWSETSASLRPRVVDFEVPMRRKKDEQLNGLGQLLKAAMNNDHVEDDFEESLDENSLEYAVKYLEFNKERNRFDFRKIDGIIHELSLDIDHQGWSYIQSLLPKVHEIEPNTFHVIIRLMCCSSALTLFLLKDADTFNKVWELSESLPFEWTAIPISAWQNAITIVKNKKASDLQSLMISAPVVYKEIIHHLFSSLVDKGEYFATIVELALDTYHSEVQVWGDLSTDEKFIGGQYKAEKFKLYISHENRLMKLSQTKKRDMNLIECIEQTWSKSKLPSELKGFFKKVVENDPRNDVVVRAQKLTIELPLLLAFYNMGIFEEKLPGWAWNYLNFLLSQLQQFDREWLQKLMSLAIAAASICLNNSNFIFTDKEFQGTTEEVEND